LGSRVEAQLRSRAAALAAATALSACNGGVNIPGTTAKMPTQLSALDAARSIKGTIYLAQGGRIWKLSAGKLGAVTSAGQQLAYPTASADGAVTAASLIGHGQAQLAVGGPGFTGMVPLSPAQKDPHRASLDLKPSLSADGKRLAFMSDRSSCCSDEAIWEGPIRRPHQVSFPPDTTGGDDAPAYLPDATGLVLVAWRMSRGNLEQAGVPVGRPRVTIPASDADVLDPAPGPGGKLAWISRKGDTANVVVGRLDGSGATTLAGFGDCRQPVWSPDGQSLVFISGHGGGVDLWSVATSGGNPQRLTWGADLDANSHPAWIAG
jgi:hypothetical protein